MAKKYVRLPNEASKRLGSALKQARIAKDNMKQDVLAGLLQITPSFISAMEMGRKVPNDDMCFRLSNLLGVELVAMAHEAMGTQLVVMLGNDSFTHAELSVLVKRLVEMESRIPVQEYHRLLQTLSAITGFAEDSIKF